MNSHETAAKLTDNLNQFFVGKEDVTENLLICLLAGGHVLLEDVPGVGKTTLALILAKSTGCSFGRIQFTPDTLPSDVAGISVYHMNTGEFVYQAGTVMNQVLLADEINRTSPKTQASLLEAMAEGQVTVDGVVHELPKPFLVIATQNPIEFIGTYPLPEAQLDRFLFKVLVQFPSKEELKGIVELTEGQEPPQIRCLMNGGELLEARKLIAQIPIADAVMNYILELVMATHEETPYIREGASPRAAQALIRASRARAFLEGRFNVAFEDVKSVAYPVLRHRVLLNFDAISEGITEDAVIQKIIDAKEKILYV